MFYYSSTMHISESNLHLLLSGTSSSAVSFLDLSVVSFSTVCVTSSKESSLNSLSHSLSTKLSSQMSVSIYKDSYTWVCCSTTILFWNLIIFFSVRIIIIAFNNSCFRSTSSTILFLDLIIGFFRF